MSAKQGTWADARFTVMTGNGELRVGRGGASGSGQRQTDGSKQNIRARNATLASAMRNERDELNAEKERKRQERAIQTRRKERAARRRKRRG